MSHDRPRSAFLSYSHKDAEIRDALDDHLSLLRRQGLLSLWHDRKLQPGEAFDASIRHRLDSADIVLLLVSAYFLASDYCYDVELSQALARHHLGRCSVIPIIARPCDWKAAPFGRLTALPTDGKPITDRRYWQDDHAALDDVAAGMRQLLIESPEPTQSTEKAGEEALRNTVAEGVGSVLEQVAKLAGAGRERDPRLFEQVVEPLMQGLEELHEQYMESFRRYRRAVGEKGPFDENHPVIDQIRSDALFYASQRSRVAELSLTKLRAWFVERFVNAVWSYLAGSVNDLTSASTSDRRARDQLDPGFRDALRTNWPRTELIGTFKSIFAGAAPPDDRRKQAIAEVDNLVFRFQQRYAEVFREYRELRDQILSREPS